MQHWALFIQSSLKRYQTVKRDRSRNGYVWIWSQNCSCWEVRFTAHQKKKNSRCLSPTLTKNRTEYAGRKKQTHWDSYSAVLNMRLLKGSYFCANQTGHVGRSGRSYFCWYLKPTVHFTASFPCSSLCLFAQWLFSPYSVLVTVCFLISSPTH